MIYKFFVIISMLFYLTACKNEKKSNKNKISYADTAVLNKYLQNNQIDSFIIKATKGLAVNSSTTDLNNYIFYNDWLYQKLRPINNTWKTLQYYCKNIFSVFPDNNLDSNSLKKITNAYYNWAELSFQNENRYDDSVIFCLEKALSLHQKKPALPVGNQIYGYKILGILYNQIGDVKKSLFYYSQEEKFINNKYENWVASIAINKSIALLEMGVLDSAILVCNDALKYQKINPTSRAELLINLANVYLQQQLYQEAFDNNTRAVYILDTISKNSKLVHEKKAEALKQKTIIDRINNNFESSLQSGLKAVFHYLATENKASRTLAKIYIELGKSHQGLQHYDSALHYFQIALNKVLPQLDSVDIFSVPSKRQIYPENTIMEALDAKATVLQLLFTQNKNVRYLQAAVHCYDLITEVEKSLLQNFSYDESRLLMLKESRIRSEKAITVCHRLFLLTNNHGWVEKAFEFAEKNKAFVLLESIKRNIANNKELQSDSLYQQVQSLQTRLAYIDRQIIENSNKKNDSLLTVLENEKNNVNTRLLLANNELKLSSNAFQALLNDKDTLSVLTKTNKLLDDKTGLIEFFVGDSTTYTFLFTKNEGLNIIKNDSSLMQAANNYTSFLTNKDKINNQPLEYQNAAYSLYNKIGIAKFNNNQITKLLFIADGYLNYVPFEALITHINPVQNPKLFSYLITSKEISYGYSIASLAQQPSPSQSKNIVAFAPAFINNENGNMPLLNSLDELSTIEKINPSGKYFTKSKASVTEFKKNSTTIGIIHIASHAYADTSANMQSSIAFYDNSIYLNELYSMHFNANLVVLSACETNIGVIDKSEGSMSLARGFYYAGAKNIITSLWNVNDKSTAILFENFYKKINQHNYTSSLQQAKTSYIKNSSATTASPYYWASFIHIGYVKDKAGNTILIWLIAILTILGIIAILYKYKK